MHHGRLHLCLWSKLNNEYWSCVPFNFCLTRKNFGLYRVRWNYFMLFTCLHSRNENFNSQYCRLKTVVFRATWIQPLGSESNWSPSADLVAIGCIRSHRADIFISAPVLNSRFEHLRFVRPQKRNHPCLSFTLLGTLDNIACWYLYFTSRSLCTEAVQVTSRRLALSVQLNNFVGMWTHSRPVHVKPWRIAGR